MTTPISAEGPAASANLPRSIPGAVAAAAFAALYLEISLMQLVSVMYYSIFVYAVIGIALLGFGAAGSLLALRGSGARADAPRRIGLWLVGFSVTAIPTFMAVNAIDVPAQELFGSWRGLPLLLLIYVLLMLPFLLAGAAIATAFACYSSEANRLYFADLLGAGAGGALAIASVSWLGGVAQLALAGLVGAVGAMFAFRAEPGPRSFAVVAGLMNVGCLLIFVLWRPVAVHVAPDKHGPILARAGNVEGFDFSRWSHFGRIDITESFRGVPLFGGDISPRFSRHRIEQRMLTQNGAAPAFLYRVDTGSGALRFLAGTSQSPAYRLRKQPRVLVIGVGGGTDVLIALHQGARSVRGVELNPVTAEAVRDVYREYLGHLFQDPRVELVVAEGRNFAARDKETYDIVQLSGVDTGLGVGAYGLGTTPESYIYTVEAIGDFLELLEPDGILSITRDLNWGFALRLCSVVRAALLAAGLEPATRIVVLEGKGWGWATILVKKDPFTASELAALEDFATFYSFPLLYDPRAPDPGIYDRVIRTGVDSHDSVDLRPSTDDWPFFFNSFRLSYWFTSWSRLHSGPFGFLLVSLVALLVVSVVLIGWPLWQLRVAWRGTRGKLPMIGYFTTLGAGFMLVEVALMQRFTVFLGNPALSIAIVLAALLLSSGLGSYAARSWQARRRDPVLPAVGAIVLLLLFIATPAFSDSLRQLLWLDLPLRLLLSVGVVGLIGFPMGMPFPNGLARIGERAEALVPWCWGINAIASVAASLGSYLVGMIFGFTTMFYAGVVLYIGAAMFSRRL